MRGDEKVSDLFFLVPLVFLQKLISNETDAYMKIELLIWNFAVLAIPQLKSTQLRVEY